MGQRGGYSGGSLTDLVKAATVRPPTRRAVRDLADAAGRAMTERARENTPTRTGVTAASWSQLRVRQTRDGNAESGTTNPRFEARLLEHGVRPHPIKPRSAEAIDTPEGPRAEADHPGIAAHHPLARAAAEVEASFPAIAEPTLDKWADDIEGRAAKHRGITKT
jgi:hypothetical protein